VNKWELAALELLELLGVRQELGKRRREKARLKKKLKKIK